VVPLNETRCRVSLISAVGYWKHKLSLVQAHGRSPVQELLRTFAFGAAAVAVLEEIILIIRRLAAAAVVVPNAGCSLVTWARLKL